jgi:dephospho-CoA kinase
MGRILEEAGVAVLDADRVAHVVMSPDGPAYPGVVEAFGSGILGPDGVIDRKKLAAVVFADPVRLERLNQLVHPLVRAECREWVRRQRADNRVAAVMIPLLFERGLDRDWPVIVAVGAPEALVRQRLEVRGVPPEEIGPRLAAQAPVEEKMRRATHAIWNAGSRDELEQRTLAVLQDILMKQEQNHG